MRTRFRPVVTFLARTHGPFSTGLQFLFFSLFIAGVGASILSTFVQTGELPVSEKVTTLASTAWPQLTGVAVFVLAFYILTWVAHRRHTVWSAFSTFVHGADLVSPNQIAATAVFAEFDRRNSDANAATKRRPYQNTYAKLKVRRDTPGSPPTQGKSPDAATWKSPTDDDLARLLQNGENVLLLGKPTSGKTRKAFEILRRETFRTTVILTLEPVSLRLPFPSVVEAYLKSKDVILVLDDLNRFTERGDALVSAVEALSSASASFALLATCRKGPEHVQAQSKGSMWSLHQRFRENRFEIERPRLQDFEQMVEGAPVDASTIDATAMATPGDLLLHDAKAEMKTRLNDKRPEVRDVMNSAQLLDAAEVPVHHAVLRRVLREVFGRAVSEAALRDIQDELKEAGFVAPSDISDPIPLESAYAPVSQGVVYYQSPSQSLETDLISLVEILAEADAGLYSYVGALDLIHLGIALEERECFTEALKAFNHSIELDESNADAYFNKGLLLQNVADLSSGSSLLPGDSSRSALREEAKRAYQHGASADPGHARCLLNLGILATEDGEWEQGLTYFARATEAAPGYGRAWCNRGLAYLHTLDRYTPDTLAPAIRFFEKATEYDPHYPKAWHGLGYVLRKIDKYERAYSVYRAAVEANPEDATSWYYGAEAALHTEHFKEAAKMSQRAGALDPQYSNAS